MSDFKEQVNVAKLLIQAGADVHVRDGAFGDTLLHIIADLAYDFDDHYDLIDYLLSKGVNPLLKDNGGNLACDLVGENNTLKIHTLLKRHERFLTLPNDAEKLLRACVGCEYLEDLHLIFHMHRMTPSNGDIFPLIMECLLSPSENVRYQGVRQRLAK